MSSYSSFRPYTARCPNCDYPFFRDEAWKVICLDCWREKKLEINNRSTHNIYNKQFSPSTDSSAQAMTPEMLRRLIQLCHPDKHANSETATLATQFLLGLKKRK